MKLFEIPIEAAEIETELAENYGELSPELEQRIADFLKQSKEKIESGCIVVRSLEADADICRDEAQRLLNRADGLTKASMRLKMLVMFALDEGFNGKLKTAKFTIWSQTSAPHTQYSLRPGASIYDVEPQFLRIREPELDKLAIKAAQDEKIELPATIDAVEQPGTRFLRIK